MMPSDQEGNETTKKRRTRKTRARERKNMGIRETPYEGELQAARSPFRSFPPPFFLFVLFVFFVVRFITKGAFSYV
jgi:hypothetical protein